MLKTLGSTESTTKPGKGGVGVRGDGGSFIQGFSTVATLLTSMLKTRSSMDSPTSATQIAVEHDEIGAGGKSVKKLVAKLSKSPRIVKS